MSNLLFIQPWGPNNDGIAEDYPRVIREHQEGKDLPAGWFSMDRGDLDAYLAARVSQAPTIPDPQIQQCVPDSVGPAQLRIAARKLNGITSDQIQAVIDAIPDVAAKQDAQDLWNHAAEIHRHNSFTLQLGSALGLSSAQIDAIFQLADTL